MIRFPGVPPPYPRARSPPPGAREALVGPHRLLEFQSAEEQWRVRQVLQRLGAAVQVGLQVLEADPVARHRVLREREDVLAHQVEELAGALKVRALARDDAAFIRGD